MLATPSPMIRPPVISGPCPSPPNPTISRPMLTTTAAISMLAIVTSTLYPMLWPGMLNPSMATKCMPQTPAAPMDTAASSSQRTREAPCRARALQGPGPRGAPQAEEAAQARHDITQDRRQQPVRKVVDDHHQRQYPPWRGPRALSRLPVLRTEHYMTGHDLVVHSPGVNNRFHFGGPLPPQPAAGSEAAG